MRPGPDAGQQKQTPPERLWWSSTPEPFVANLGYLQLTRNCYQQCRFCSNPPTGVDLTEDEMRAQSTVSA